MTGHSRATRWKFLGATLLGIIAVSSSTAAAATLTFDFETLIIQSGPTIVSTVNGVTLTVTRHDGSNINVQNLNNTPPAFGLRTLSNFAGPQNATSADAALLFSFSAPVSSASISFGDLGGFQNDDDDSPVTMTAFSGAGGTGSNLGSVSAQYPITLGFTFQGNGAIGTLTATGNGQSFQSFSVSGGGPFPGTLYFDNVVVNTSPVPEPASMLLLGTGLAGVLARRRLRRD